MLNWEELERSCSACTQCDLCKTRHNVVFGVGPKDADIMLIGEGPGEQEDIQGEPFVGAAGKFLDDMLSIIGLSRKNCYIANIVKCRPPHNRDPKDSERDACIDYLYKQITLIRPKIIVCLGRIAAKNIIYPDYRITREHGTWVSGRVCGSQLSIIRLHFCVMLPSVRRHLRTFYPCEARFMNWV